MVKTFFEIIPIQIRKEGKILVHMEIFWLEHSGRVIVFFSSLPKLLCSPTAMTGSISVFYSFKDRRKKEKIILVTHQARRSSFRTYENTESERFCRNCSYMLSNVFIATELFALIITEFSYLT